MLRGSVTGRLLSVLAVLLALTACSGGVGGPEPAPTGPDRPRDLPLDGVEPCELLTEAQRAELGLNGDPIDYNGGSQLLGDTAACSIRGFQPRAISVNISLSTERGIDTFDDAVPPATAIKVAGFPAVLSPPGSNMDDNCAVGVDVADGQVLAVLFSDGGRIPPIPLDQLCAEVPAIATEVVETLLAR